MQTSEDGRIVLGTEDDSVDALRRDGVFYDVMGEDGIARHDPSFQKATKEPIRIVRDNICPQTCIEYHKITVLP